MFAKLKGFTIALALLSPVASAAEQMTADRIREVMTAADEAAKNRDTAGIGIWLGEGFYKYIEVPAIEEGVAARIDKQQYLDLIDEGWEAIDEYTYERTDVVINIGADGSSGTSNSTIIETVTRDGEPMVSKVREYARYEFENGRPVIVNIETHTLVGDTTPE